MSARLDWTVGETSLHRVVESEGAMLAPFEIFGDCTQAHLDANRDWLVPRFQDRGERAADHHHPELPDPAGRPDRAGRLLRRQRQGAQAPAVPPAEARPGSTRCARPASRPRTSTWCCARICTSITSAGTRGWRTAAGCRPFPNARYLIAQREWDFWRNAGPAALERTGDFLTDSVLPIIDSGQAEMIGDSHALKSDISIEPVHGHTPGQKMLRLGSGAGQALLTADMMHHPLQLRIRNGARGSASIRTWRGRPGSNFLKENANSGRLIFPTHFPSPTGGPDRARRQGLSLRVRRRGLSPYSGCSPISLTSVPQAACCACT